MNIALVCKKQAQSAHFSGRQQSLHCTTVYVPKSGELFYVYHFSDVTAHDWAFVDLVIRDIFTMFSVSEDNVVIWKSDNCSEQYKCLHCFGAI